MSDPMAQYNPGDIAFTIFSMALVWLMIPGIGYFYSGMAREKNALSLIMCSVLSLVVVSVQVQQSAINTIFSPLFSGLFGDTASAFQKRLIVHSWATSNTHFFATS